MSFPLTVTERAVLSPAFTMVTVIGAYVSSDPRWYCAAVNVSFEFVEGEALMLALRDVAVSSGSACTSASLEPSYVLRAMGVSDEMAHSSIRFGLGRTNTEEEVDEVARRVVEKARKLREMSPAYEEAQDR